MGPFVPDLISDQMNLVVALLLGLAFGWVLEQAGFSSSRRLAGVFYGYDFTVLRVFFTAAATAAAGVLLLGSAGYLDTEAIFVNPTWMAPAIVGGIIMGAGFIVGGYCPGTSVCAAAIGKVDAMFFVGGGLLGVFAFGEGFPLYERFYESTALGPLKVSSSLGLGAGTFTLLLILAAVAAFAVTTRIEKRVAPESAPSLAFDTRRHALAAAGLVAAGVLALVFPDYRARLLAKATDPRALASRPAQGMCADELAFRIVDREPRMRVVDIRPSGEVAAHPIPGALAISTRDLFGKEWRAPLARRHLKKVIVGASESEEKSAYLLLQELGYDNLAVLEGGFPAFASTILTPGAPAAADGRWAADVLRFRENARTELAKMTAAAKSAGTRQPKKEKKIQGGC